jgi:tetratricopeptide (TPR) repeat protein
VAALAALAAANFPWRIALVAYPQLIFLAWIFAPRRPPGDGDRSGGVRPPGVRPSAAPDPGARRLAWVLAALLVAALVLEGRQAERRLRASHQLAAVEDMTRQLASRGLLSRQVMERQAHVMQEAAALDPVEVGIPIARGAQYLLLGRYDAAIRAYEEALELEARGEIYANLGRARFHAGDREGAREAFTKALRLNPALGRKFKSYVRELNVRGPGRLEEEEEAEEDSGLP